MHFLTSTFLLSTFLLPELTFYFRLSKFQPLKYLPFKVQFKCNLYKDSLSTLTFPTEWCLPFVFFWLHHTAWGTVISWPWVKPVPPVVETPSLNHWTAREVPLSLLNTKILGWPKRSIGFFHNILQKNLTTLYSTLYNTTTEHIILV